MVSAQGCGPGFPRHWAFYPQDAVALRVAGIGGNDEALKYGMGSLDAHRFGNNLLALEVGGHSIGYEICVENRTAYAFWLDWRKCGIVDADGWTHGILHPDLSAGALGASTTDVIVGPQSKRLMWFIPASHLAVTPPGGRKRRIPFHAPLSELRARDVREHLLLSINYRGRDLFYDVTIAWEATDAIRQSNGGSEKTSGK